MSQRRLLILYGSQTGCAKETAERVQREARRLHFQVELKSMEEYSMDKLPSEGLVVFICSVTGQGEEPDNMKVFWKFLLRKDLPKDSLNHMRFGVFGQGDSSYVKFNFPAKKLHKRLLQLGANPLVSRGDGDDQHYLGIDGALDPWLAEWWEKSLQLYPIPSGLEIIPASVLPPNSFNIKQCDSSIITSGKEKNSSFIGTVSVNRRLTPSTHFQDVRHIEISVKEEGKYQPGDVMVIYPQNRPEKVQTVLDFFGWSDLADTPIQFEVNPEVADVILPTWLENPISPRCLFERHLDIFGRPRRFMFQLLSFFTTDSQQIEKLQEFNTAEGQNDLYAYAHKTRRTIFEVLTDFSTAKIPLKYLLDLIPAMRPRSFSISSSPLVHSSNSIHLTVAIVDFKTKLQQRRVGVCTDWMGTWQPGGKGTMSLPRDGSIPIICIGPGTGVAQMRSFLHQRHYEYPDTRNCLIFGSRYKSCDFFYESEWKDLNLLLITAFSRDQEDKIYVQHQIRRYGKELWNMIHEEGAYIYLSGNAKRMPVDVADALMDIFKEAGGLNQSDAKVYLEKLEKNHRFQQECWS